MSAPASTQGSAGPVDDGRLAWRRKPVRLALSPAPWRAAGYLISYLVVSGVVSAVAIGAAAAAAAFSVTVVAVPLVVAAASVVHWSAGVERGMLRRVFTRPVRRAYLPGGPGPAPRGWARARAAWRDGTWRELGYLAVLWIPLYTLGTVVLAIWLTFLAGITLPAWYWAPRGAAAGFAVLFLLFNYVLVATARMHGRVARSLLGPPPNPLAAAQSVLAKPGPLGPLIQRRDT